MMADWIYHVMERDLRCLVEQIKAYDDDSAIWKVVVGITNAPGTLAIHIAGNIQHYIGVHLGGSSYVRDRDAEFSRRDVPRAEILIELAAAQTALESLAGLDEAALNATYPEALGGVTLTTGQFMVHLASHLAYHLGQVDYHRRILTGDGALPGMVSPRVLAAE
jgi:uncharacterized damage-inducible protein DinB